MKPIQFLNAADDPAATGRIEDIVTLWRIAVAPMLEKEPDELPMNQGFMVTAAAIFAGITVGHMIALDIVSDKDKRRLGEMVLKNFRGGIELGKSEARAAMLEQLPTEGST